ncbi:MAG: hypothetical protein RL293_8 [Bacteroidota bacterium]
MKRLLLALLGMFLITWIGFVSYDLLQKENTHDFRAHFHVSDGAIWAIHQPNEVNWADHGIQTVSLNQALYSSLSTRLEEPCSYFFSAKKVLFLVEKRSSWTKKEIQQLFQNGLFPIELGKLNSFEYGKLHGVFKGNQLLIYDGDLDAANEKSFQVDAKASLSRVILSTKKNGGRVSDIYLKKGRIYTYTKSSIGKNSIKELDDRRIFAPVVPSNIESYSFYERSYLAKVDPVFAHSVFSKQMISSGVVFVTKDKHCAAIFDYQEDYSPIDILNEHLQIEGLDELSAEYKHLRFAKILEEYDDGSSQKPSLHIALIDGFAVVSTSKEFLDYVISESELSNTLSQDEKRTLAVYGNLPKKVAFRHVSKSKQQSISVYGKKLVETNCRLIDVVDRKENQKIKDYFVMNPGVRVIDFAAFPERGNVIALTENHTLVGYINGLKKWEKPCPQEVLSMQLIDIGQSFVSVQFATETQLFDKTGRLVFRMSSQNNITPSAYFAKNKMEFVIANTDKSIQILNDKGTVIKPFQVNGTIKQIAVTTQAKKPILGVLTSSMYYTIDLEKRKTLSKVNMDSTYSLVNTGVDLIPISARNSNLTMIKNGKTTQFSTKSNVKLLGSYLLNKELTIILSRGKELYAYQNGKIIWEKTISAQEISALSIQKSKNGTPILCILDALENELFIFDQLGRASDQNERHGEIKVQVSPFGTNAYSITTFLGSYLIQYTKQ